MSYSDDLVSDLNEGCTFGETVFAYNSMTVDRQSTAPGLYWVDQIPVIKEVKWFADALRREMPWVKFGIGKANSCASEYSLGEFRFCELAVYSPGDRYTLGRIGYKDYGVTEYIPSYGVFSRKIKNKKVSSYHDKYNTATSKDLSRSVRNAVKYLQPYSPIECARISYDAFRERITEVVSEAVSEADKFISACADKKVLVAEITNLIRQDIKFVTPQFIQAATHYLSAAANVQEIHARNVMGTYVLLQTYEDKQFATLLQPPGDVRRSALIPPQAAVAKHLVEELPAEIQTKLAVLMSVGKESYVSGVGYKEDDTAYWVESDPA